jgi:hypothetical protein
MHRLPNYILRGASASESSSPKSETSESWYLEGHSVSLVARRVHRWLELISLERISSQTIANGKISVGAVLELRDRAITRRLTLLRQARDVFRAVALQQRSSIARIENMHSTKQCQATTMMLKSHNCDRKDWKVR